MSVAENPLPLGGQHQALDIILGVKLLSENHKQIFFFYYALGHFLTCLDALAKFMGPPKCGL